MAGKHLASKKEADEKERELEELKKIKEDAKSKLGN